MIYYLNADLNSILFGMNVIDMQSIRLLPDTHKRQTQNKQRIKLEGSFLMNCLLVHSSINCMDAEELKTTD